ncbi:MAG: Lrp/AsnC ligand binding domain-containing protein [Candidatus Bathyarchaeia archaeon]
MHELHALVNIFVESSQMDEVIESLSQIDVVEELYEVTGEFDVVAIVSASDIEALSDVLKKRIMKIKGIKSTVTSVILSAQKGPVCAI